MFFCFVFLIGIVELGVQSPNNKVEIRFSCPRSAPEDNKTRSDFKIEINRCSVGGVGEVSGLGMSGFAKPNLRCLTAKPQLESVITF